MDCHLFRVCSEKVFAIRRLPNLALVCERLSNINCTSHHYSVSCCGSFLPYAFCKKFEPCYRQMQVTPNMHLHSHLVNCGLDYGPVNNFWLFSSGHQGPAISKLILIIVKSFFLHLRTVPTIVIAHTFCASPDTRISCRQCLLIQGYFCAV